MQAEIQRVYVRSVRFIMFKKTVDLISICHKVILRVMMFCTSHLCCLIQNDVAVFSR